MKSFLRTLREMWINSSIILWWTLSPVSRLIRKPLISTLAMKCQERLSIFSKIKISIKRIAAKRQELILWEPIPEWRKIQLQISTNPRNRKLKPQANDNNLRSTVINEMWEMHNYRWKSNRNNKKSKSRRNFFWTVSWKKPKNYHLSKRGNLWLTKIYRKCWSTSTESSTAKHTTNNTSHTATIQKSNLSRKLQRMRLETLPKRKKRKTRRKSWRNHFNIFSHSVPKSSKDILSHQLTGTQSTRIFWPWPMN